MFIKFLLSNKRFSFQILPLDINAQQASAAPQQSQSQANAKPSWASLFGSATPKSQVNVNSLSAERRPLSKLPIYENNTSKTDSEQAKFAPTPVMSTVSAPGALSYSAASAQSSANNSASGASSKKPLKAVNSTGSQKATPADEFSVTLGSE